MLQKLSQHFCVIFFGGCCFYYSAFSQNGSGYFYGGGSVTSSTSIESLHFFSNPALLFHLNPLTVQLSLCPTRFGLKELQSIQGFVVLPEITPQWDNIRLGLSLQAVGDQNFSELSTALSSALFVSESVFIGGEVRYFRFNLAESLIQSTFSGKLGVHWTINSAFYLASTLMNSWYNPVQQQKSFMAQEMTLSLGTTIVSGVSFDVGVRYSSTPIQSEQTMKSATLNVAGLFTLDDNLSVRLAWMTNPMMIDLSLYYRFDRLLFIYSPQLHVWLGVSHRFGLQYSFNSNQ